MMLQLKAQQVLMEIVYGMVYVEGTVSQPPVSAPTQQALEPLMQRCIHLLVENETYTEMQPSTTGVNSYIKKSLKDVLLLFPYVISLNLTNMLKIYHFHLCIFNVCHSLHTIMS